MTDTFFKQLKKNSSKYVDLINVQNKLSEKPAFKNIINSLEKIIDEEFDFT